MKIEIRAHSDGQVSIIIDGGKVCKVLTQRETVAMISQLSDALNTAMSVN